MPPGLVQFVKTLTALFTIDFSALFTSPKCGADATMRNQWVVRVMIPIVLAGILLVWALLAKCCSRKKTRKKTLLQILHIAIRLLLLGLYKTAVETSLGILNCENFEGDLIWKDNKPCPLGGDDVHLAVVGLFLLVLYGLFPYLYITAQLCRHGRPQEDENRQTFNYVMYGWATEGYKSYAYLWEPVNALIILLTVIAAELLTDESQQTVQATIAGASILVHLIVRPYEDRAGNLVVVLFGICELLGVIGADENLVLQSIHLVVLIVTVLILIVFSITAAVSVVREKREQMRFNKLKDKHYTVSRTEGAMLAPLLLVLWVLLSPLFFISTTLSNAGFARWANLFLRPLALILSIVQHSVLGAVAKSIGFGEYLKAKEKKAWVDIREMNGIQEFDYRISERCPELLGDPVVVGPTGYAAGYLNIRIIEQVGYARYRYFRPEAAQSGDDITIKSNDKRNIITLHFLKKDKISATFPAGVVPGKIISSVVGWSKWIIFDVSEEMIAKPYNKHWNPKAVAEAGSVLWNTLSWKEQWEIEVEKVWLHYELKCMKVTKKYTVGSILNIVHPTGNQSFNYKMMHPMDIGESLNVRHSTDGQLWVNGQLQESQQNEIQASIRIKINELIEQSNTTVVKAGEGLSSSPLSTQKPTINTDVQTLQYHLHRKITQLSTTQKATFFGRFGNGLVRGRFDNVLKSMFIKSSKVMISGKLLNAAWLSVRQNDASKTTISLEQFKTWCTPSASLEEDHKKMLDHWNVATSILRQKNASIQSRRIQQEALDASMHHQNQMFKRKQNANYRLQQRLAARNGTAVLPRSFQVQPLEQLQPTMSAKTKTKVLPIAFNANLVANFVNQHQTAEQVMAIREKSETSRQKKADETNERQKSSSAQLQKRLALRHKAKQARALKKCKPFQTLSDQAHDQIVDLMSFEQMQEGTVLCKQGDAADRMYLLMLGHCSVQVNGMHVDNLYELDVFGEAALFNETTGKSSVRSATVIAEETVEVLILSGNGLKMLVESNALDQACIQELEKVATERKNNRERHIKKAKQARALKKCTLFQTLSDRAQDQIVDAMSFETMKEGTSLCKQGSVADRMYLLMSGHCSVQVDALHVADLYELDVFGEAALFGAGDSNGTSQVRSATVRAEEVVEVLVLSFDAMKTLIQSNVLDKNTVNKLENVAEKRNSQNEMFKKVKKYQDSR